MKAPEQNDYVVVKVTRIIQYGAYVELEEFPGWTGFIHISEVAPYWVKNIRSHVREGQTRVAKVLKVYPDKKSTDLSLKRVPQAIAKRKMEELRRSKRGKFLLELAAKSMGRDPKEVEEVLEKEFGDVFGAFENAALYGREVLESVDIDEEWKRAIVEIANKYIEIPRKKVMRTLEITVPGPYGAKVIRESLLSIIKESKPNTEIRAYVAGVPRYTVEVISHDYRTAEKVIDEMVERIREGVEKEKGKVEVVE